MCHWSKTKFADTLVRLETLKADVEDGSEIYRLANIVENLTHQVAGELQDQDARLQHLEHHLRTTGPTPK